MNHKVLLADDSLTIQKVIKITLANQPYDISECSSEAELFEKLPLVKPTLVFLDFNLSDKYTGYELTSKIKSILPSTKVLLLLGTFDNVDDAALEKSGASDKIVKPFDSNKFIAICKQLIDSAEAEDAYAAPKEEVPEPAPKKEEFSRNEEADQWQVSHSTEHKLPQEGSDKNKETSARLNALDSELSDWGMSIPGIINGSKDDEKINDLPPVIEPRDLKKSEGKLPSQEDLDYPTIEELEQKPEKPKSNLISIESFKKEESSEEDFTLEGSYTPDESNVSDIEEQIRDEVEGDLWQADEFEDLKQEISSKVEAMQKDFQPTTTELDEDLFHPRDDENSISWSDVGGTDENKSAPHDALPEQDHAFSSLRGGELEDLVKKYVKEYMDEMFKNKVEKVAWDVIPDLAENLIRQELGKIAAKVLNDDSTK